MPDVTGVECLENHRLALTFEDGARRELDVTELVPFDGVFAPLRNQDYFRSVRVNSDIGTIVWPNGADFCPDVLYERSRPMGAAHAQTAGGAAARP
ncbi:MAG: DUF2442 domain-containing protein [Phycisphaerales bacterium]|nr:DUF2442 domain-containing protein [Phycisphaerales bacterium]